MHNVISYTDQGHCTIIVLVLVINDHIKSNSSCTILSLSNQTGVLYLFQDSILVITFEALHFVQHVLVIKDLVLRMYILCNIVYC